MLISGPCQSSIGTLMELKSFWKFKWRTFNLNTSVLLYNNLPESQSNGYFENLQITFTAKVNSEQALFVIFVEGQNFLRFSIPYVLHGQFFHWFCKKCTELRAKIRSKRLLIKGKFDVYFVNHFGKKSGEQLRTAAFMFINISLHFIKIYHSTCAL